MAQVNFDDETIEAVTGLSPDDMPSNSYVSKGKPEPPVTEQVKAPAWVKKAPGEVGKSEAQPKKKTFWQRTKEAFIGTDCKTIPEYLWFDVLVPSVKKLFVDSGVAAIEKTFGTSTRSSRQTTREDSGYLVPYDRQPKRNVERPSKMGINFEQYWFAHRDDAEAQLDRINALFDYYHDEVPVSAVKELFDEIPKNIDHKWGWTERAFRNAGVVGQDGGYVIYMPEPKWID